MKYTTEIERRPRCFYRTIVPAIVATAPDKKRRHKSIGIYQWQRPFLFEFIDG
jgi:CMP-2-keto-3-deoxyoctulosonic acid synthetase